MSNPDSGFHEERDANLEHERILAKFPEKFRRVIEDLVASGASFESIVQRDDRAKATPEVIPADNSLRVEIPGSLDLTKYGIESADDLPTSVSIRGSLTIDGKMFFELNNRNITIDGDLIVRDFNHTMLMDHSRPLAEELTRIFYDFNNVAITGEVKLESKKKTTT